MLSGIICAAACAWMPLGILPKSNDVQQLACARFGLATGEKLELWAVGIFKSYMPISTSFEWTPPTDHESIGHGIPAYSDFSAVLLRDPEIAKNYDSQSLGKQLRAYPIFCERSSDWFETIELPLIGRFRVHHCQWICSMSGYDYDFIKSKDKGCAWSGWRFDEILPTIEKSFLEPAEGFRVFERKQPLPELVQIGPLGIWCTYCQSDKLFESWRAR